jgi:hypothetical protein
MKGVVVSCSLLTGLLALLGGVGQTFGVIKPLEKKGYKLGFCKVLLKMIIHLNFYSLNC